MPKPFHIVVFRFSSLGDVAMTVPVLKLALAQYPQLHITMVSTPFVKPLFHNIERLQFYEADVKGKYKGINGLYRLCRELKKAVGIIDGIADLHNVLRTKTLRALFSFSHVPVAVINKGRKEKRELTRRHHKILRPLKSTFERYADVFASLGFPVALHREHGLLKKLVPEAAVPFVQADEIAIGIAPFARYEEKTYPPEKMQEVLRLFNQHGTLKIFLFGGKEDKPVLQQWEETFANVRSVAGIMAFEKELQLISQLDLMISMDSANMHLASLYGVPVVSVWGGTHPWLGFYGWGQAPENAVQVALDCRPSSVFGNKQCPRGDLACLNRISPLTIYETVVRQLAANEKGL